MGDAAEPEPPPQTPLLEESTNSLQFVSILLLISVGLLAVTVQRPISNITMLQAMVQVLGCLFACVFYGVAAGEASRMNRPGKAQEAIVIGNAVSEYLGLLNLLAVLPLTVWSISDSRSTSFMAHIACMAFLIAYHISGLDLLSRSMSSPVARACVIVLAVSTASVSWYAQTTTHSLVAAIVGALWMTELAALAYHHIYKGEQQRLIA